MSVCKGERVRVPEKPLTAVLSGDVETIYLYLSVAHTMTLLNCRHVLLKSGLAQVGRGAYATSDLIALLLLYHGTSLVLECREQ